MKLLNNIFCFIFLLSIFVYSQDCKSTLFIKTDFPEVQIFINDSLVSSNGDYIIELPDGLYKIVVDEISDRWNAKTFIDSIELKNCEEKTLEYKFDRGVYLNTEPQDAYVFINDSLIGNTPIFLSTSVGQVKLSKDGFENILVDVNSDVHFRNVELNFNGIQKSENFVETTLFKILTGTAIVLGATTAYFKLKADDKFEEYQFTGNKDLLDETDRYDLISGISLGLLQVNFGYIIYRFLSE